MCLGVCGRVFSIVCVLRLLSCVGTWGWMAVELAVAVVKTPRALNSRHEIIYLYEYIYICPYILAFVSDFFVVECFGLFPSCLPSGR